MPDLRSIPRYDHDDNVGRVECLMMQGYTRSGLMRYMREEGRTDSLHTLSGWVAEVRRRWAAEACEQRPALKDLWRLRLEKLYMDAYQVTLDEDGRPAAGMAQAISRGECVKIAKLAIALDGLAQQTPPSDGVTDPIAMTPAEREAELQRLLRRREEALQARATEDKGGN